jgi:uncharacterized protein YndB with AHSA1/START domain
MANVVVSGLIPAAPARIFKAWFDAAEHSAFTGGRATKIQMAENSPASWLEGLGKGTTLSFDKNKQMVHSWRGQNFHKQDPTSELKVSLKRRKSGDTEIVFEHLNLPDYLVPAYEELWMDSYVLPMRRYFQIIGEQLAKIESAASAVEISKTESVEKPSEKKATVESAPPTPKVAKHAAKVVKKNPAAASKATEASKKPAVPARPKTAAKKAADKPKKPEVKTPTPASASKKTVAKAKSTKAKSR